MITEIQNNNDIIHIKNIIYEIRGQKVMIDSDLARLYHIEVKIFNQAVKRNLNRFPIDFMFQLTKEEWEILRSQFVTSRENLTFPNEITSFKHSGRRYLPYVFTEQGVAMLSSVLKSEQAIEININIMRAFVTMRHYALKQNTKDDRIEDIRKLLMLHIENTDNKFSEQDATINQIAQVLNNLIEHPKPKRRIGFVVDDDDEN